MSYLSKHKYNRYRLSRWQVKQQEAERKRLELDEQGYIDAIKLVKSFSNILEHPVSDVTALCYPRDFIDISLKWKECSEPKDLSEYIPIDIDKYLNGITSAPFSTIFESRPFCLVEDIKDDIRKVTAAGRNKLTGKEALHLKSLLIELQKCLRKSVVRQRRKYNIIQFGKRTLRRRDHRQHIRNVAYGIGRFMHVFSEEEESENTDNSVSSIIFKSDKNATCIMSKNYLQPWIALSSLQMAA